MNDELDEIIAEIDIDTELADQASKGADISKLDHAAFSPAKKIFAHQDKVKEVKEKRKENSKTFKLSDTEYQVVMDKAAVHFTDENGELQETNLLIRDKNGKKVMTNAHYKVRIFTDQVGYRLKKRDGTEFTMKLQKIGDVSADFTNLTSKVEGCQMFWEGVTQDISMKLLLRTDQPELYTRMDAPTAPRKFVWRINHTGNFDFTSFGADANGDNTELITSVKVIDDNTFTYTEEWTGRVSRITDKATRIKAYFDDPIYPVTIDPTVTLTVSAGNDDGGITGGGAAWVPGNMDGIGRSSHVISGGVRFLSVGVPAGATITSAFLKPQVKSVTSGIGVGRIKGNKVASAAAWSNADRPNNMTKTTASTNWTPTVGVNSIAITGVVAEIVAQGGWASGNNMKFAMSNWPNGYRYAYIYDFSKVPAKAAQLVINYTTGGASFIARRNPLPMQAINRSNIF